MCAYAETDVRESAYDCALASGEGYGSCGEMYQPIYGASGVASSLNAPYLSERKMFQTNVVEESEIHILYTIYGFPSLRFF
jgi:hypothetical protein